MPRLAFASNPNSKAFTPSDKAFSISIVPQTRSSVAPRGKSTMMTCLVVTGRVSPLATRRRTSSLCKSPSVGWLLNGSSATTSISGKRSARARTVVDLPVPRSPMTITPPILGSMTLSNRASFISSCPITAVKGNTGRLVVTVGLMGVAIKVF